MKEHMWEVVARGTFVMPCLAMDARLLVLTTWVRLRSDSSVLDRNVVRGKCSRSTTKRKDAIYLFYFEAGATVRQVSVARCIRGKTGHGVL